MNMDNAKGLSCWSSSQPLDKIWWRLWIVSCPHVFCSLTFIFFEPAHIIGDVAISSLWPNGKNKDFLPRNYIGMKLVKVWKQGDRRDNVSSSLWKKRENERKEYRQWPIHISTIRFQAKFYWGSVAVYSKISSLQISQISTQWFIKRIKTRNSADTVVSAVLHSVGLAHIDARFSHLSTCHVLRDPSSQTSYPINFFVVFKFLFFMMQFFRLRDLLSHPFSSPASLFSSILVQ